MGRKFHVLNASNYVYVLREKNSLEKDDETTVELTEDEYNDYLYIMNKYKEYQQRFSNYYMG